MSNLRPSWEEYYLQIAYTVAQRSTCLRRKVGAVVVRDTQIISTAYNGAPRGVEHCESKGCLRKVLNIPSGERHEICRAVHAEQNLIIQAASHGISLKGASLYCTTQPCILCAKMLINVGIKEIFFPESYDDTLAMAMLEEAKIPFVKVDFKPNMDFIR